MQIFYKDTGEILKTFLNYLKIIIIFSHISHVLFAMKNIILHSAVAEFIYRKIDYALIKKSVLKRRRPF